MGSKPKHKGENNQKRNVVLNKEQFEKITKKSKLTICYEFFVIFSCTATVLLAIYAYLNYGKFLQSLEIASKNIQLVEKSIKLAQKGLDQNAENISLTHKPVIFVKNSVPPQDENEIKDGRNHWFVITNSGRMPARNVRVKVTAEDVYGSKFVKIEGIGFTEFSLIESTTVYSGQEVFFRISDDYISFPARNTGSWQKALISITLSYQGEGIEGESTETQYFIFSEKTGYRWRNVGSDFLRRVEREREKKSKK